MRHRTARLAGALGLGLFLLLFASAILPGPASAMLPGAVPAPQLPARGPFSAHGPATLSFAISGSVLVAGNASRPRAHDHVAILSSTCRGSYPSLSGCPHVANATTNAVGHFSVAVANGSYLVVATAGRGFGGSWSSAVVRGGPVHVSLDVYPYRPYGRTTIVLPGWNNLSAYAANCNFGPTCPTSGVPDGTQVPVVAWSQDGVFYVNASNDLVFYSFPNRTAQAIAPWVPLYQNLMSYDGIENTEWATVDDSFVYEFGCTALCRASSTVELYAVNVSTGTVFQHTFTGIHRSDLYANAQIDLIGRDGNHSIAALIEADGAIVAYDLWNGTQWTLGRLPFFEANNCYWVPSLDSYIDVEAGGSSTDLIEQLRLEATNGPLGLTTVFSGHYASHYLANGVDGLYFNVSARRLYVSESTKYGNLTTEGFAVSPSGNLSGPVVSFRAPGLGQWPNDSAEPNVYASEHRPQITGAGPFVMGFYDGLLGNDSWQFEPSTGEFVSTNVSVSNPPPANATMVRENALHPGLVEGLFSNASYSILTGTIDCATPHGTCPLRGTAGKTPPGTIAWAWELGQPRFPFPASSALAQSVGPSAPNVTVNWSGANATLNWTTPATGADPLVNYSLQLEDGVGGINESLSPPGSARTWVVRDADPNGTLAYALTAWNLHGPGVVARGSVTVPATALPFSGPARVSPRGEGGSPLTRPRAGGSCANVSLSGGLDPVGQIRTVPSLHRTESTPAASLRWNPWTRRSSSE
jgi:hypothetical protein